jgi:microcystin-dependent protein
LHVEHPPHILQPLEEEVEVEDTVSEAGSYYTILEGGLVTKERVLDEEYGRPKRRLFPVVDIKVKKRSKVGTAEDIVHQDLEDNDLDSDGGDEEMQANSAELPIHEHDTNTTGDTPDRIASVDHQMAELTDLAPVEPTSSAELPIHNHDTNTTGDTSDRPAAVDHQNAGLTDLASVEPTPLLTPLEDVPMDLGEPTEFEDPLDDGTPYSPVIGPRPDDILFDLSDDDDEGEGEDADQTQRSESEVWAELEDQEMTQAFTPAGMLGDYELSDDEEDDTPDPAGNAEAEAEAETVTDAIRAAILQPQSGDESAARSDHAPRADVTNEEESIKIVGPVLENISEVALDGVATERLANTLDVEVETDHENERVPNAIEDLDGVAVTKPVPSTSRQLSVEASTDAPLEKQALGDTSLENVESSTIVTNGHSNEDVVIDAQQSPLAANTYEAVDGDAETLTTTVSTEERTIIPANNIPLASMASEMEIEQETLADPFEAVNNPVVAEQVVNETAVVDEVEASLSATKEDHGPANTGNPVETQPLNHESTPVTGVETATELQVEKVDHNDTPAIVQDIDGESPPPVDADDVDPLMEEDAPMDVQEVA